MKLPKSWVLNLIFIILIVLAAGYAAVRGQGNTMTVAPAVKVLPVVLADGRWAESNQAMHDVCMTTILGMVQNTIGITDEYLESVKDMYWLCMSDLKGSI